MDWTNKSVLITGGTGSFGKAFVEYMLREKKPRRLVVYSRDELKQHEMRQIWPDFDGPVRYFIGDVRDQKRLERAMEGVDIVVHAAALKQVPACEYNPVEAIATNINGSKNVIEAAINTKVKRVLALSTDKAVNPSNLYGASKLAAEKLFIQSNAYGRYSGTLFSCVRYGNVIGSRGSVLPVFLDQAKKGTVTVTDERMTRFWITLPQAVQFVVNRIEDMHGGEVFVPKIKSAKVVELAKAIVPEANIEFIGIRPGEKLHEILVGETESRHAVELDDFFVIKPMIKSWTVDNWVNGRPLPDEFTYASDTNDQWFETDEIRALAGLKNGNGVLVEAS